MSLELNLKKFDPSSMEDNRTVLIIGKRNTGKSVLSADLMYHKRHIPSGVCFSGTEVCNKFWCKHLPDLFIYDEFDEQAFKLIKSRQLKTFKEQGEESVKSVFCILDDCGFKKGLFSSSDMRFMFMNGRHLQLFFLITLQYVMDMGPDCRENVDYVFILRTPNVDMRKKIYTHFFGIFPNFDMFCKVMDQCTENFECLVLDNTQHTNKIEECVFWYKAKIRDKFRVGDSSFWGHHYFNYNQQHYIDKSENDELSRMFRKTDERLEKFRVKKLDTDGTWEDPEREEYKRRRRKETRRDPER